MEKAIVIIALIAALFLVSGCIGGSDDVSDEIIKEETMEVEKGNTVYVHYTGTFDNGEVFDSSEGKSPLQFIAGAGQVIKGFDDGVMGMKLGEEKDIHIEPEDAYGTDPAAHPLGGKALNFKITIVKIEK